MDLNNLVWDVENNSYADATTGQLFSIADVAYQTQISDAANSAASSGDWGSLSSIIDSLGSGAKDIVTALNSFQLQQLNLKRAQQGLAPLNPAQYAPQVGLNLSAGTMNLIMYGMIGIGAIMLLKGRR